MRIAVLRLLVAMAVGCSAPALAQAQQCQLKLIASYDMQGDSHDEVLVPIVMAGKPVMTIIDTGAFSGVINTSKAADLGLIKRAITPNELVYVAKGTRYDRYVTVPTIDIGPIRAENVQFVLSPDLFTPDTGADALLGANALENFDIELDFAAKKIRFFSQDHCDGKVVYWSTSFVSIPFKLGADGSIQLEMTLDGRTIDTVLDTGSSYTLINQRVASQTYDIDTDSPNVKKIDPGNSTTPARYAATFDSLSIGGITMPKPTLILYPDNIRRSARRDISDKMQNVPGETLPYFPHLLLGMDVLHQLHVYIAYKERQIYVTPADAH